MAGTGSPAVEVLPGALRPASQREELLESLTQQDSVPWTYVKVAQEIGGNQYEDFSHEAPDLQELKTPLRRHLP